MRWAVHPINQARALDGALQNMYKLLRDDGETFSITAVYQFLYYDEFSLKLKDTMVK